MFSGKKRKTDSSFFLFTTTKVKAHSSMDSASPLVYRVLAGLGLSQAARFLFLELPSHNQLVTRPQSTNIMGNSLSLEYSQDFFPFFEALFGGLISYHIPVYPDDFLNVSFGGSSYQ